MDFGLARPHELEKVTGVSVTIAGTLGYMAPELRRGQRPSKASDIFALGIVIHQVLTGQRPAESRTDSSMVALPALRSVQAPAHFVQAVPGLLSMEPEMRVRAFEQLRSAESGSTTSTLGRLYARRSKQIWFTAADGGPPEKLIATGTGEGMPSWAPDGTSVTFAYLDGHNQAVEGIYSLDLVTRRVSLMPRSTGLSAPSWSPDGKYLLALAKSPSRMMLYSAKTKVWSELRKGIAPPPYYWVWSKDSQYVYVRPDDAANAIYRLSILSGKWEKIGSLEGLRSRDGEGFLCLTADGRIAAMSHTAVAQIFSMRWKP
jgi:serine/threonine protein kinase